MVKAIKDIINKQGLFVITGPNGSGKTRLINQIKQENHELFVLDTDSHCHLNKDNLLKFGQNLKEKSKNTCVIVASLNRTIIDIADKVITLEKSCINCDK